LYLAIRAAGPSSFLCLLFIRVLLLEELDKSLSSLKEMLLSVGLGSLLVPVDDCLVRNTVGIIEYFDNASEGLHDSRVGVAVNLDCVDEVDLGLGAVAEWLKDGSVGLMSVRNLPKGVKGLTVTC